MYRRPYIGLDAGLVDGACTSVGELMTVTPSNRCEEPRSVRVAAVTGAGLIIGPLLALDARGEAGRIRSPSAVDTVTVYSTFGPAVIVECRHCCAAYVRVVILPI